MCSYAAETRFGRNGRQRKSSPERGGNDLLWDYLLLVSYHIGTLKSSKLVVNYGKIVVFRGFRGVNWGIFRYCRGKRTEFFSSGTPFPNLFGVYFQKNKNDAEAALNRAPPQRRRWPSGIPLHTVPLFSRRRRRPPEIPPWYGVFWRPYP